MNKPKAETGGRRQAGGKLIYVVDDEPMLLELASVILAPLGYAIETFSSAEAAARAYEITDPKPAVIITDYAMYGLNGLELAEACRRIRSNQKVLLVSGTVGPEICQAAAVKPNGFLASGTKSKQLLNAVRSVLAA